MGSVIRKVLTSPWEPALVNSPNDGAAIDIPDLAAAGIQLPTNYWMIIAWIYIISMQLDTGALLSVTIDNAPPLQFKWSPTDLMFVQGSQSASQAEARPDNKWFMVVMGSNKFDQTGGSVFTRDATVRATTWAGATVLKTPASLKAPVGAGNFNAEVDFSLTAASLYGLPMLTEQDSFVCYRTSASNHDNARCAMEEMMGNLGTGAITVTKGQCYQLIQSQWPVVDSWFAAIFPTFSLPNFASNAQKLQVKTTLQLWILQFGPATLKSASWQTLVAAFNNGSADWTKYLGWAVSPRGYTLDGANTLSFPAELEAWLGTENGDLVALNVVSTVCNSVSCGFQAQCASIDLSYSCAV